MPLSLSPSELDRLTLMYKKEKDKIQADRINIILLSHKGYSGVEISGMGCKKFDNINNKTRSIFVTLYP